MKNIYIFTIILIITSCSSEIQHRKAVIGFKTPNNKFNTVKSVLNKIAQKNEMLLIDSSYKFGTEESSQTRFILHLKDSNNLEIYTNCYSDWKTCSIEFLCYKPCPGWKRTVELVQIDIAKKWEIINAYKHDNV